MTRLQWMDLSLSVICGALAAFAMRLDWRLLPAWSWLASSAFCALSAWFSWADRLWLRLRPAYIRLFMVWRLR